MKNSIGTSIILTVFGESHGKAVGVVIDGLTPGLEVSDELIKEALTKRRPLNNETQRTIAQTYVKCRFQGHTDTVYGKKGPLIIERTTYKSQRQ